MQLGAQGARTASSKISQTVSESRKKPDMVLVRYIDVVATAIGGVALAVAAALGRPAGGWLIVWAVVVVLVVGSRLYQRRLNRR
ncbi:hypothetical protein [Streptomyces sp. SID8352]|uniref:hypothetical protein n=1 Tax=Streptomyces sp. SID8352 TaxID=2690338 RepID=UPI00136A83FD|nr:hypothetical protein [Streptomyces sp. SID8352]MYU21208.1 hypothetical protein [Streptomyces sp. SID8352]